jgi:L-threonylcarbamoyladenylate synthase
MPQSPIEIQNAIALLRRGEVVAIPTETVYGLAGDVFNEAAIQKIFAIKKRPFFDPLIVHVASREDVNKLVDNVPKVAEVLMQTFWPGPLTLVLPKKKQVSQLVTSGLDTVGVRMPKHPTTLAIIKELGSPLAAPSANIFGHTSPTTAEHVREEFANAVQVVDGGNCAIGLESTVIGFAPISDGEHDIIIYRPGAVTAEMLRVAMFRNNFKGSVREKESQVAPGHLQHHYMPKIPLVIVKPGTDPQSLAVMLCEKFALQQWRPVNLILSSEPVLAARQLYAKMRECAESGATVILVEKNPHKVGDLWAAIWNRLEKAASLNFAV